MDVGELAEEVHRAPSEPLRSASFLEEALVQLRPQGGRSTHEGTGMEVRGKGPRDRSGAERG